MKAISAILLNLWEKCLKFGENRGNIRKIYDDVRKELQDECHCAYRALSDASFDVNLPDLAVREDD